MDKVLRAMGAFWGAVVSAVSTGLDVLLGYLEQADEVQLLVFAIVLFGMALGVGAFIAEMLL